MFWLNWLQAGGSTRGTPRRDRARRWRWPVLGLMAGLVLLQSGCQSGPFSHCGRWHGPVQSLWFLRSRLESGLEPAKRWLLRLRSRLRCARRVLRPLLLSALQCDPLRARRPDRPSSLTRRSGLPDSPTDMNAVPDSTLKSRVTPPPGGSGGQAGSNGVKSGYQARASDSGCPDRAATKRRPDQDDDLDACADLAVGAGASPTRPPGPRARRPGSPRSPSRRLTCPAK